MKQVLFTVILACAGFSGHAQVSPIQIAAIKTLLTSKTWKTQATKINGLPVAEFESTNNIHNVDIFPVGNRFKFSPDGTFVMIMTSGGSKTGVWDVNADGQFVFNPGQAGGIPFGISKATPNSFTGSMIKRLGLCSVSSLYEINWISAQ
jgi:hypothetical protein